MSVSQPAGSGCPAASAATSYDSVGNISQTVDFDGATTTYQYDLSRSLETQRVEGAGTSGARTRTTSWHPAHLLESRRAEPKLITTSVYNGQPDPTNGNAVLGCVPTGTPALPDGTPIAVLCKKVLQATSDTSGALGFGATAVGPAQVWQYTYNKDGQVLTENGPRTDVSDVTTYEYYSATDTATPRKYYRGDLKQVTDAKGRVTQYTEYTGNGYLKRQVDPNGTVTQYTYSPRNWLTSAAVSTGGVTLTTSYEYWPTGKLKKLTQPDGSFTRYTYDAAQRLTGVSDSLSNSVTYTLDNAGNRTGEQYHDSAGTLRRQISRSYDALNRLEFVTGSLQ